jgi:hypothetical protein
MNDATTLKQVGRDCLQSYTGLANPEHLCAAAELMFSVSDLLSASEDDEGGSSGGGIRYLTSIDSYLPFVACTIRQDGWLSRGAAYKADRQGQASADLALSRGVYWRSPMPESIRLKPTEKDYNLAAATIQFCEEFFADKDVMALSDYENSLRVAMASGIVHPKFTGIIASAIQFYQKDLERRQFAESRSAMFAASEFQGAIGERSVFENLQVVTYKTWEGQYGVTHFYTFRSEAGHCFIVKASRDLDLSIGQVVSLKGTVKSHDVYQPKYKGEEKGSAYKQTRLNRVALVTRATVKSVEVVEKEEQDTKNVIEAAHPWNDPDGQGCRPAKYGTKVVKYHHYHLVGVDGRQFVCVSKSKKKVLVVGYEAVVEYDVEDFSNGGERPVGFVA